jgi:hypothetical protein
MRRERERAREQNMNTDRRSKHVKRRKSTYLVNTEIERTMRGACATDVLSYGREFKKEDVIEWIQGKNGEEKQWTLDENGSRDGERMFPRTNNCIDLETESCRRNGKRDTD